MVADTAYSREPAALRTDNTVLGTPGKRRLGLFRALAAPFKDLDDRVAREKRPRGRLLEQHRR
jgi:hypothetical protein